MVLMTLVKTLAKAVGKGLLKNLPRLFKQGKKALNKVNKIQKKLDKIPGMKDKDIPEAKPKEPPKEPSVEEKVKSEEENSEAAKEGKKLSEEMNIRAMARAAHANLLRNLAGNIEAVKLSLAPEGETEKLVSELKGKEGEPESSVAALSNTGKILANQVQLGEAIKASNATIAELAKTTADSDSADLLADRMDKMQDELKEHMNAVQDSQNAASADAQAKNQNLMKGIASGVKGSMNFMKSLPDKMDKAAALKDMLKDTIASVVEDVASIVEAFKILFDKIPILKWIKQGIGAVVGLFKKHVWPFLQRLGAGFKKLGGMIASGFKKAWGIFKKVINIASWFIAPVAAIRLAIKGVTALVKFFGKSKEEREKEKAEKKAAKEAKKKEKKAAKEAKKKAKENQESTEQIAPEEDSTVEDAEVKPDTTVPDDMEGMAKEGGVDVGKVDTEGVTSPEGGEGAEEELGATPESGDVETSESEAPTELTDADDSEGDSVEDGDLEESEAESSSAVHEYNQNTADAEAAYLEDEIAQERARASQAIAGELDNSSQTVNIVQHTKDDPGTQYDDYMGG